MCTTYTCVWNDFSDRNKRPKAGNSGWLKSVSQVAVDLLRDRQHQSNDQPSNYAIPTCPTCANIIV